MNTMNAVRKVLVCALMAFALTGTMSWAMLQSNATVPASELAGSRLSTMAP
jgi:hypothetical protein